ncbi:hypothetical protein GIB67_007966 [Kingdonia uniflora]|uniref:Uncharacterized protein n=1 Tax=Kingdonia uniflora TaxID=39325 RepID=A0A7J7LTP7_9MAGN|nr:hypothetical protein GIB67_007966 [Kingdonia uniflora]
MNRRFVHVAQGSNEVPSLQLECLVNYVAELSPLYFNCSPQTVDTLLRENLSQYCRFHLPRLNAKTYDGLSSSISPPNQTGRPYGDGGGAFDSPGGGDEEEEIQGSGQMPAPQRQDLSLLGYGSGEIQVEPISAQYVRQVFSPEGTMSSTSIGPISRRPGPVRQATRFPAVYPPSSSRVIMR